MTPETGDRMIILISDGQSADLGNGQEEEVGKELLQNRICVYSIHIGSVLGVLVVGVRRPGNRP